MTDELNELAGLKQLKELQFGKEQDWLHLIIERIDLDRRSAYSESEIFINFNFDSGLVYDFNPYRMWVSPMFDGYESPESQYEVRPTSNFLKGKRSQLSSLTVTIKDRSLLQIIEDARKGNKPSNKGLKIEMMLRDNEAIQIFRGECAK